MTNSSGADQNENESVGKEEEQPTPPDTLGSQDQAISAPISSDLVVPPEEQLTAPPTAPDTLENFAEQATQLPVSSWLVVAKNRRVNRDWEALLLRAPENARRCYQDLSTAPMVRKPKRVFPLKGKRYLGAWEYEVTSSDRVFYVPDEEKRKVLVYYAGTHPKTAPTPP
ncbi:hypothetical protein [Microseira wollei]|uniref:Uncharacterized protein n=1 Tax=Microseira wollei NIES-4236 TaxID=2530354 RepID=A0AAV3XE34_9CYAN|nr:hypothetical protein [Microseira wollei]GET38936.1 hypothetical protein MiSe_36960 [Microseira wollei NIES-4236]